MASQKPNDIFDHNAFEYEFTLQEKDEATGKWIPAVGIQDLSGWISSADGGEPLAPELKLLCAERVEKPGTYFARLPGDTVHDKVFTPPLVDGTQLYVVSARADGDVESSKSRRAWLVKRV